MIVYLIRHAKSNSNEKKLVTGDIFDRLSPIGINQANNLKNLILSSNISADFYYVSQWARAQETAKIIKSNELWEEKVSLGETNAGSVKNLRLEDFLNKNQEFYLDNTNSYPQGESHTDLYTRVTNWFDEILRTKDDKSKVMITSHSGPISCILQYISNIGIERFPYFLPSNASITIIDIPNNDILKAKIKTFSYLPIEDFIND